MFYSLFICIFFKNCFNLCFSKLEIFRYQYMKYENMRHEKTYIQQSKKKTTLLKKI